MLIERLRMCIAYVFKRITALIAGTPLLLSLVLGGCASTGSSLMDARAEARSPPKTDVYLPVHELPAPREQAVMTPDERSKLQKALVDARSRQAAAAKAQGAPLDPPMRP
jgi:hypothetical protein